MNKYAEASIAAALGAAAGTFIATRIGLGMWQSMICIITTALTSFAACRPGEVKNTLSGLLSLRAKKLHHGFQESKKWIAGIAWKKHMGRVILLLQILFLTSGCVALFVGYVYFLTENPWEESKVAILAVFIYAILLNFFSRPVEILLKDGM